MAVAQVSASYNLPIYDASTPKLGTISKLPTSNFTPNSFLKGSPLVIHTNYIRLKAAPKANSAFIKCEQSANGLDVWLGRVAMVGFAVAISVEISTGKGLLENFGLTSPLPTAALAVAGLGGVLTAVLIFQSASKN